MIKIEKTPPVGVVFHEYANLFPMMDGPAFREFVEDIRTNGVHEPIVFMDEKILDGRNRYVAARECGIEYPRVEYDGEDPLGFVISLNLKRRHLTESQRGMVAAKLAKMDHGGDRVSKQAANLPLGPTQAEAAEMLNVSERTVRTAKQVEQDGSEELVSAVEAGKVSVSAAADIATLPKDEQADIAALSEKEILAAAKKIRTEKAKAKREENEKLAAIPVELLAGKFGTIVIDPPWKVEKIERDVRPKQSAFDYPTMGEAELLEFGVQLAECAAEDCHLFMWTTHKHLPLAIRLVDSWGWKYVLTMVWHKPGGFQPYNLPQYNCEFCIYARHGAPKFIDTKAFNVCFEASRREHSRKPDEFYDLVRRVTADGRIDIFSREKREGFEQHGNETEKYADGS